jgi:hypothetical protein
VGGPEFKPQKTPPNQTTTRILTTKIPNNKTESGYLALYSFFSFTEI